MDWLSDFGLADGDTDDIFVFWRHAAGGLVTRRAVLSDYAIVGDYLPRLLRYLGAEWQLNMLQRKLLELRESGRVIHLRIGRHRLGLGRPYRLDGRAAIDDANPPFLICREDDTPDMAPGFPVLAASREAAVQLVRAIQLRLGADRREWREYACERVNDPIERLLIQIRRGAVATFPTDLEAELAAAVHAKDRDLPSRASATASAP